MFCLNILVLTFCLSLVLNDMAACYITVITVVIA